MKYAHSLLGTKENSASLFSGSTRNKRVDLLRVNDYHLTMVYVICDYGNRELDPLTVLGVQKLSSYSMVILNF